MSREKGKVNWFDPKKGFGFIRPEIPAKDGQRDYFVHQSNILMQGYRTLEVGQSVEFDLAEGSKGLQAVNVTVV